MSDGKLKQEMDRQLGVASAVMRVLRWTVVMKKDLSQKAELSSYQSIYIPIPTYCHELWVMTMRSWIHVADVNFLRRVAWLRFKYRFMLDWTKSLARWLGSTR